MPLAVGSTPVADLRLGALTVTGRLGEMLVTATVPGAPTIDYAYWTGQDTLVEFLAPASDGGSAITGYEFTFNGVAVAPVSSASDFRFAANYTGQQARVRTVNAVGAGPYSEPVTVEVI